MSAVLNHDAHLVRYDAMCTAIAECHQVDEVKDIRDKAMALEMYSRQARNTQAERRASEVRLRAERRSGELLKELARADYNRSPGRGGKESASNDTTQIPAEKSPYAEALERTGVSRQTANRYQALANIPEQDFEDALRDPVQKPTTSGLIRSARDPQPQINRVALKWWGVVNEFERESPSVRPIADLFDELTPVMQDDLRRVLPVMAEFYSNLAEVIANEHS